MPALTSDPWPEVRATARPFLTKAAAASGRRWPARHQANGQGEAGCQTEAARQEASPMQGKKTGSHEAETEDANQRPDIEPQQHPPRHTPAGHRTGGFGAGVS